MCVRSGAVRELEVMNERVGYWTLDGLQQYLCEAIERQKKKVIPKQLVYSRR